MIDLMATVWSLAALFASVAVPAFLIGFLLGWVLLRIKK